MGIISGGGGGGGLPLSGGTLTGELIVNAHDGTASAPNLLVTNSASTTLCEIDDDGEVVFDTPNTSSKFTVKHNGTLAIRAASGTVNLRGDTNIALVSSTHEVDVSSDGLLAYGFNAAPGDGSLIAEAFALWLDSTNGAAKLMVKAKQANGTVVAAAIALA